MKNIRIRIQKNGKALVYDSLAGYDGENNASKIVIEMEEFVDGEGIIEVKTENDEFYVYATKENETYSIDVLSALLVEPYIEMQLRITQDEETIYKSEVFELKVENSINATEEIPEQYPEWIDVANAKMLEIDNAVEDLEQKVESGYFDGEDGFSPTIETSKVGKVTTITIEDAIGTKTATILDGNDGKDGQDGKDGTVGPQGPKGDKGDTGAKGDKGDTGSTGATGPKGDKGDKGDKGETGSQGPKGDKGDKGDTGPAGTTDYNELQNKPDLSQFVTKSVNDLTNYYLKSETYTQSEVNSLISAISSLNIQVVQTLPTHDISATTIYLVPKSTSQTNNVYDEYIYVNNTWELIGTTEIDLSNYALKSELPTKTSDLTNDSGFINTETDPVFSNSPASGITNQNISNWNNKSDFSGDYNDLTNKPIIPIVPTNVSAFTNDAGYLTQHQDISGKEDKTNKVTSLSSSSTDTQYPSAKCVYDMIGNVESILETLTTGGGVN